MRTFTNAEIAELIQWLSHGTMPARLANATAPAIIKFRGKYRNPPWNVRAGALYYNDKPVVSTEGTKDYLQNLYSDPATRLNGRDRFYARVSELCYGITSDAVLEFLKGQELYQLHQPIYRQKVVKPLVPTGPFEHWQVDTVYMHKAGEISTPQGSGMVWFNRGNAYMLTVIDCFSKYAWAFPMKRATEQNVIECLQALFAGIGEVPHKIQTDKGFEFGQGMGNSEFVRFLHQNGIVHSTSSAYAPASQGCIERFNRTLKQMIYQYFTAQNTQIWFDRLDPLLENYNGAYHTTIKDVPKKIHDAYLNNPNNRDTKKRIKYTARKLQNRAEDLVANEHRLHGPLEVGDHVRIAVTKTDSKEREKQLKGFRKAFRQNWSKEIYIIKSVSPLRRDKKQSYTLYTADGHTKVEGIYYRGQLQPVETDYVEIGSNAMPMVARHGRERPRNNNPPQAAVIPVPAIQERVPGARARRAPRRLIEE